MNFVAISSDGQTLAADGNTLGNHPRVLGLWKFPTGDYLQSIAGGPVTISLNFRYVATESIVQDLETGKNIF